MIQIIDPRRGNERFANIAGSESGGLANNSEFWGAVGGAFSSLADMFGNIFAGAGNKNNNQQDTVSNAGATYIPPSTQSKNYTWLWIVGTVGLIVLAVILLRKFKK